MKISIITVVFNNADTIEDTIRSVASQKYSDIQHVIVDGGSTDGTLSVLEKHRDKLAKVVSEHDQGMYDAMNKGLMLADGEVVGTLNADDFYANTSVIGQVASVFRDPDVDACYADLIYVDRATASKVIRYWKSCPFRDGLFAEVWCPPHPTFFVRKWVYETYGRFDLSYKLATDVELMMRFLEAKKIRTVHVPRVWVKMRTGGTSNKSFRNILMQNINIARAARQHNVPFNGATFLVQKLISRARQFYTKPR